MTATLLSQTGKITRQELQMGPVPQGTSTHQPLSHYEIVEALLETLGFSGGKGNSWPSCSALPLEFGNCRSRYGVMSHSPPAGFRKEPLYGSR